MKKSFSDIIMEDFIPVNIAPVVMYLFGLTSENFCLPVWLIGSLLTFLALNSFKSEVVA
jgi:hypothetical protein